MKFCHLGQIQKNLGLTYSSLGLDHPPQSGLELGTQLGYHSIVSTRSPQHRKAMIWRQIDPGLGNCQVNSTELEVSKIGILIFRSLCQPQVTVYPTSMKVLESKKKKKKLTLINCTKFYLSHFASKVIPVVYFQEAYFPVFFFRCFNALPKATNSNWQGLFDTIFQPWLA